jgi:hypothetical protein
MGLLTRPPRRFFPPDLLSEHPLARGLVSFSFPGDSAVDLVTGRVWSAVGGTIASTATPYGPAISMTYGVSYVTDAAEHAPICPGGAPTVTHIVVANPSYNSNVYYGSQVGGIAAADGYSDILFNVNSGNSTVPGSFTCRLFSPAFSSSQAIDNGGGIATGVGFHMYGASHLGVNNAKIYYDGANLGTSCLGSVSGAVETKYNHAITYCDFPVVYRAVWSRALSDAEHASFAANPWQLFAA